MAEKERNKESIVVADNKHTWRDKLENYFWKNLLSILWSLLLLIGGFLLFAYYFFHLKYFPLLDLSSSLAFIAAAGLSGLVLFFFLLIVVLLLFVPGQIWSFLISDGRAADYFSPQDNRDISYTRHRRFLSLPTLISGSLLVGYILRLSHADRLWTIIFAVFIIAVLLMFKEEPNGNHAKSENGCPKIVSAEFLSWRIGLNIVLAFVFLVLYIIVVWIFPDQYLKSPAVSVFFVAAPIFLATAILYREASKCFKPSAGNGGPEKRCYAFRTATSYFFAISISFLLFIVLLLLMLTLFESHSPEGDHQLLWWIVSVFGLFLANFVFVEGPPLNMQNLSDWQWKARVAGMTLLLLIAVTWKQFPVFVARNLSFGAMENILLTIKGGMCNQLARKLPDGVSFVTGQLPGERHDDKLICELPPLTILSRLGAEYYVESDRSCPKSSSPKQQSMRFTIPSANVVSWSKANSAEEKIDPNCTATHNHEDGRKNNKDLQTTNQCRVKDRTPKLCH